MSPGSLSALLPLQTSGDGVQSSSRQVALALDSARVLPAPQHMSPAAQMALTAGQAFRVICWNAWSLGFVCALLAGLLPHGSRICSAGQEQMTFPEAPEVAFQAGAGCGHLGASCAESMRYGLELGVFHACFPCMVSTEMTRVRAQSAQGDTSPCTVSTEVT